MSIADGQTSQTVRTSRTGRTIRFLFADFLALLGGFLTGVAECQCSRNGGFSGPSWRHSPSDLFVLCRIGDEAVAIAGDGLR